MTDFLDNQAVQRYKEKIKLINNIDPYAIDKSIFSSDPANFPNIEWGDIINYLVFGKSAYTLEDFKAFKGLEAYNQFICNWIKSVEVTNIAGLCIIVGKVLHSQRLSQKPLLPWIIATPKGEVKCAHCTCIAGLGEACTHVAAVLFFIQDAVRNTPNKAVTDLPATWTAPSSQLIKFSEVKDIDFPTPYRKRKERESGETTMSVLKTPKVNALSVEEFNLTLKKLHEAACSSAILNIVKPYCEPSQKESMYPPLLKDLYDENLSSLNLEMLQKKALEINFKASKDQANALANSTLKQTQSALWHQHRVGRITASNFKAACSASIEKPPLSLIKKICYPNSVRFTNAAVKWGCTHESTARKQYSTNQQMSHKNFKTSDCGLLLHLEHSQFGATPDAFVECSCCGQGLLEVKCPYCLKDCTEKEIGQQGCLETKNNVTYLRRGHQYYYQVQAQLFVADREYCDFVVWTSNTIFTERIYKDILFWSENFKLANTFFHQIIVPELMAQYFTKHDFSEKTEPKRRKSPMILCL